jgi:hypothetical protein
MRHRPRITHTRSKRVINLIETGPSTSSPLTCETQQLCKKSRTVGIDLLEGEASLSANQYTVLTTASKAQFQVIKRKVKTLNQVTSI